MNLTNIPPINPFYVRGVKIEMTSMLGAYIWAKSKLQEKLIVNYLEAEGFFDREKEMELIGL